MDRVPHWPGAPVELDHWLITKGEARRSAEMSGPPLTERAQPGDRLLKRPDRLSRARHSHELTRDSDRDDK